MVVSKTKPGRGTATGSPPRSSSRQPDRPRPYAELVQAEALSRSARRASTGLLPGLYIQERLSWFIGTPAAILAAIVLAGVAHALGAPGSFQDVGFRLASTSPAITLAVGQRKRLQDLRVLRLAVPYAVRQAGPKSSSSVRANELEAFWRASSSI
jgi:hypothetical protein